MLLGGQMDHTGAFAEAQHKNHSDLCVSRLVQFSISLETGGGIMIIDAHYISKNAWCLWMHFWRK